MFRASARWDTHPRCRETQLQRATVFGRVWESEEIDLLRSHRKQNVPLSVTAKQLGRSYSAVRSYASDHGILKDDRGSWTAADDALLLVLARNGVPTADISQALDRSVLAVRQRLGRLQLRLTELRELGPVELP